MSNSVYRPKTLASDPSARLRLATPLSFPESSKHVCVRLARGIKKGATLKGDAGKCIVLRLALPHQPHADLELPRLTGTISNRSVEIEDQVCGSRAQEIGRIEDVEHVDNRLNGEIAEIEVLG